jgi:hypothetical protein
MSKGWGGYRGERGSAQPQWPPRWGHGIRDKQQTHWAFDKGHYAAFEAAQLEYLRDPVKVAKRIAQKEQALFEKFAPKPRKARTAAERKAAKLRTARRQADALAHAVVVAGLRAVLEEQRQRERDRQTTAAVRAIRAHIAEHGAPAPYTEADYEAERQRLVRENERDQKRRDERREQQRIVDETLDNIAASGMASPEEIERSFAFAAKPGINVWRAAMLSSSTGNPVGRPAKEKTYSAPQKTNLRKRRVWWDSLERPATVNTRDWGLLKLRLVTGGKLMPVPEIVEQMPGLRLDVAKKAVSRAQNALEASGQAPRP